MKCFVAIALCALLVALAMGGCTSWQLDGQDAINGTGDGEGDGTSDGTGDGDGADNGDWDGGQPGNGDGVISPAAAACIKHNGEYLIVDNPDGSQSGECVLPDGGVCTDEQYYSQMDCYPEQVGAQ